MQPDSIIPNPANPQNWNRYSYVENRPILLTDPSGHDGVCGNSNSDPECENPDSWIPLGGENGGGGGNGGGGVCSGDDDACWMNNDLDLSDVQNEPEDILQIISDNGSCGDPGYYSPRCPGWHFYYMTNIICPANLHCTAREIAEALSRYAWPYQWPWQIARSGDSNSVSPFGFFPDGSYIDGMGRIRTFISRDGLTTMNVGERSHIFYDGIVVRRAFQSENEAWYVTTIGMGNNTIAGMDSVNQNAGSPIFWELDRAMTQYIANSHMMDILSGMLP